MHLYYLQYLVLMFCIGTLRQKRKKHEMRTGRDDKRRRRRGKLECGGVKSKGRRRRGRAKKLQK